MFQKSQPATEFDDFPSNYKDKATQDHSHTVMSPSGVTLDFEHKINYQSYCLFDIVNIDMICYRSDPIHICCSR